MCIGVCRELFVDAESSVRGRLPPVDEDDDVCRFREGILVSIFIADL